MRKIFWSPWRNIIRERFLVIGWHLTEKTWNISMTSYDVTIRLGGESVNHHHHHHHHHHHSRLSRIRPLGLLRFRILFSETYESLGQLVGLFGGGGGTVRRKAPTYTQDNTTQKNADTLPCLEWDSNPRSQCSSDRREYVRQTARSLGPASVNYNRLNVYNLYGRK
jgi:hypothetical protein